MVMYIVYYGTNMVMYIVYYGTNMVMYIVWYDYDYVHVVLFASDAQFSNNNTFSINDHDLFSFIVDGCYREIEVEFWLPKRVSGNIFAQK